MKDNGDLVVGKSLAGNARLSREMHGRERGGGWFFLRGWYRLTAPRGPGEGASLVEREAARRGRLVSAVVLLLMLAVAGIVTVVVLTNPGRGYFFGMIGLVWLCVSCLALYLNRRGKTLAAGFMVVVMLEVGVASVVLGQMTLDVLNLPLLDVLVGGEVLAVLLLPAPAVFVVALFNCFFIWVDLLIQPHTGALGQLLATGVSDVYLRPIGLEVFLAMVLYLWARSCTQALARADRADVVTNLEQALAEQKRAVEGEKQQLEVGVQLLVHMHAEAANGNINAKTPVLEAKALWPLAGSLNTLLTRIRRLYQAERELQQTYRAASYAVQMIHEARIRQRPFQFTRTHTVLDPLLAELNTRAPAVIQPVTLARRPTPMPQASVVAESPIIEHSPSLQQWIESMKGERNSLHAIGNTNIGEL